MWDDGGPHEIPSRAAGWTALIYTIMQHKNVHKVLLLTFSWTGLHLYPICSGPSSSLHYLGHFKNPRLID